MITYRHFAALIFILIIPMMGHTLTINLEKTPPASKHKTSSKKLGPVILDARGSFEFATGHFPNVYNMRWQDYSQTGPGHEGDLDPDFSLLARKLRVHGINPKRKVIIFGDGVQGDGSEGRIAWMLAYFGIQSIEVKNFNKVKGRLTTDTDNEVQSVAPWEPQLVESLRIRKSELSELLKAKSQDSVLIDVRMASEFEEKKPGANESHITGAINIPWTSFFDGGGEISTVDAVTTLFKDHKVDISKHLIFYSNQGVRSGFVTFIAAKAKLNASNYDGGFNEWEIH